MFIGNRIRELRIRRGLSQADLGKKIGTEGSVISRWETNRVSVSPKYITKIANALDTSTDYLLDGNNAPTLPDNELTSSIEHKEKRLIIKNRDIHIDLPETEESFEIIRRFFDMQANKNGSE